MTGQFSEELHGNLCPTNCQQTKHKYINISSIHLFMIGVVLIHLDPEPILAEFRARGGAHTSGHK